MTHYADLKIRILTLEDAGYPVELTLNHDLHYERGATLGTRHRRRNPLFRLAFRRPLAP
jgi:hypothetical protein